MPSILSVGTCNPENPLRQAETVEFAKELFEHDFSNIDRLLRVFQNGQIQTRYFANELKWYKEDHSLQERNDRFIEKAVEYGVKAINHCMNNERYLQRKIATEEIDAIYFVSSTGFSTPSIEARIMNILPFSPHTKRVPIWGLGCAGGASGLSRAHEYCLAYPSAKVLVLCVELCSLTFQKNDRSKSNLIGTSLFGDGVSCALIIGDDIDRHHYSSQVTSPKIRATQSTLMPDSEDVMGWDVKNSGLYVVFSKDIPNIVKTWLRPNILKFLQGQNLTLEQIQHYVTHPGGIKVLNAYADSLSISESLLEDSLHILQHFGNMSSATVLYVLERFMGKTIDEGELGIVMALGPGFSSEILLIEWSKE
ncbi:type III polyketide synthase [Alkalihalobacillus sp. AL-G]|uniref:type III polyketide synthase n=1 Tax=Alkalihalobacillus sp. AL-G TaxID=2926399 RepID=UPI00272C3EF8|nr:3-oxoacyl-[acyl-carrier-protein] synthase III C-terminal domain-containing protein [Alkalihalobacillus sp. AL-G]WLD91876.1 type III polyketide synthase [Alkalihalobacillus sp. AL-G]